MNNDAKVVASPLWVRLVRCVFCLSLAGVVSWRGIIYEAPGISAAMPFLMCQLTAATLEFLALMNLLTEAQDGPS